MKIELKSSSPITLSGIPITVVSFDLDTGIVEYTVDGVGLKDITRVIQETLLSNIFIDGSGKRWDLRRIVDKDETDDPVGFHHLCGDCHRLITTLEKISRCPQCGSENLEETTIEESLGEVPHD